MKKRNKHYRPRPICVPAMIGNSNIFAAPMRLLDDIRNRYVLEVQGAVMMPATDMGSLYGAADALRVMARYIDQAAQIKGVPLDTAPVMQLAARLEADMPIDDAALAPVDLILQRGMQIGNHLSTAQALQILGDKS